MSEYDYDTVQENDNEIKDNYEQPQFVTLPQTLLVNEGDTIRLPCFVNRLEGFVMLWKRGKDIITVGNQIVDKNVRLEQTENGNNLVIGPASPNDEAVSDFLIDFNISCVRIYIFTGLYLPNIFLQALRNCTLCKNKR